MNSARDFHLGAALNNAWANATLYRAMAGMDKQAFAAQRPGYFPSLSATMNHIYAVDLFYLDALKGGGKGRSVFDRPDVTTPQALATLQATADNQLVNFCRDLSPVVLAANCVTDRREGQIVERVADLLPHLFQHQIHHRGQAHVQLQCAGVAPPQLDDFYLAHGRALDAQAFIDQEDFDG